MEKKTKLITIEYEEYKTLIKSRNEVKIEFYLKLIESFRKIIEVNNFNDDTNSLLKTIIRNWEIVIKQLEKEGENNE